MQVACPGCPTDTFTETLNTQTKLGSWKGKGARSGLARGAGVDSGKMMEWGRRAPKKKSGAKIRRRLSNPSTYLHVSIYVLRTAG